MRAYWERDVDISDVAALGSLTQSIGIKSDRLIAATDSDDARARLSSVTQDAGARGVFGAPMFILDGEMFWGKDRLDFVERLLTRR
jgi:2-hydroxychromene-2-carboxylate isomerase